MTRYRKKPVIIDAVQMTLGVWQGDDEALIPAWLVHAAEDGVLVFYHDDGEEFPTACTAVIRTLEGDVTAQIGDWIIKGVAGELYPCKPDIFAQIYELAE